MIELSPLSKALIEKGWRRLEDVGPTLVGMEGNITYLFFLNGEEEFIFSDDLKRRAIHLKANLGQDDGEWLVEHQEMLSECPEDVRYILFPGTVWEHPNGALLWVYLYRTGKEEKEWNIYVFWLDFGFSDKHARLVRRARVTS